MKFVVEIRNVDTLATHSLIKEGATPHTTHKDILLNILENNEEVVRMNDEEGHVVFEENRGFLP